MKQLYMVKKPDGTLATVNPAWEDKDLMHNWMAQDYLHNQPNQELALKPLSELESMAIAAGYRVVPVQILIENS